VPLMSNAELLAYLRKTYPQLTEAELSQMLPGGGVRPDAAPPTTPEKSPGAENSPGSAWGPLISSIFAEFDLSH
jgi:hypothetical protein